jgi:hypothetical protein
LDGVSFGSPSVFAFAEGPSVISDYKNNPVGVLDDASASNVRNQQPWRTPHPVLLDLQGTDVAELALTDIDLRVCSFRGALNLDQIHLEGPIFLRTPAGWQVARSSSYFPARWRWTNRLALAEEHRWRIANESGVRTLGWCPYEPREAQSSEEAEKQHTGPPEDGKTEAQKIANLYRALRKSLEDRKDEPGAADFYYGEMEMRRRAADRLLEKALLTTYWCVSGYALRASRAIAWLMVVILVSSLLLVGFGFQASPRTTYAVVGVDSRGALVYSARQERSLSYTSRFLEAVIYSFQTTTSLLRAPTTALTSGGRIIDGVLRLLGPLLYGLALLSLRGRVKR